MIDFLKKRKEKNRGKDLIGAIVLIMLRVCEVRKVERVGTEDRESGYFNGGDWGLRSEGRERESARARVCVCVCVREREREEER